MYTETYINYLHMETRLYHRMDRLDREQESRAESKPRKGPGGAVFIYPSRYPGGWRRGGGGRPGHPVVRVWTG